MKFTERFLYGLGTSVIRKQMQAAMGNIFFEEFRKLSKHEIQSILPKAPDIGKSVFRFNYQFAPAYIAWYKALTALGIEQKISIRWIWKINEAIFRIPPKFLMHSYGRVFYLGGFRKHAKAHELRTQQNSLHEYDFHIRFHDIDKNSFGIDITRCGMRTLSKQFDALGLFPGICRIDYIAAHYMGCGFSRTKTLGDGDSVCDCVYLLNGMCEWNGNDKTDNRK